MTRLDKEKSLFVADADLTVFKVTSKFLIVGCALCDEGQGWIRIYNPETVRLLKLFKGEQGHEQMGMAIGVTRNVDESELIWYTSRIRSYLKFNTFTTYKNVDT